jgi:alcohol dehydrogenase
MKAAVVPAVSGSWQIKDVAQPEPGPNQVLVKMHASGICYTDVSDARWRRLDWLCRVYR